MKGLIVTEVLQRTPELGLIGYMGRAGSEDITSPHVGVLGDQVPPP